MSDIIADIQNVTKTFVLGNEKLNALDQLYLSVRAGEFLTIMGSSGSGKSTLLNILGCLDMPTSGRYLLNGNDVKKFSGNKLAKLRNEQIGFVFQSYNLLAKTNALDNVQLPLLYNSHYNRKQRIELAKTALQEVGLEDRMKHTPSQLSGGQQQRVSIARTLVNNPSIILADEATGNLDSKTTLDIMKLFLKLHKQGRTIIFVTHEDEIAEFSERTVVLKDGSIVEDRSINDADISSTTRKIKKEIYQ